MAQRRQPETLFGHSRGCTLSPPEQAVPFYTRLRKLLAVYLETGLLFSWLHAVQEHPSGLPPALTRTCRQHGGAPMRCPESRGPWPAAHLAAQRGSAALHAQPGRGWLRTAASVLLQRRHGSLSVPHSAGGYEGQSTMASCTRAPPAPRPAPHARTYRRGG